MKKSRFSEEQITYALRQADSGTPVADICRQLGVSEASFYYWRKKFGSLGISGMREMRQLREENARLIARHSGCPLRVNQDDKGSRGALIMPLMIDAGKLYGSV
jgi:putative transposase